MEALVQAAAITLLNSGRPFDGGFFRPVRERHLLLTLVTNGTSPALAGFQASLPGRVFAGGSVAMLAAAGSAAAILAAFAFLSFGCACRTVWQLRSRRRQSGEGPGASGTALSRRRWRQLQESQQPSQSRPVTCCLAAMCLILLLLFLLPMILGSAANFRMHREVAPASGSDVRQGSVQEKVARLMAKADKFLAGLTDQIRAEAGPVMRSAEALTERLKTRAQAAYQDEFKRSTGAAQLMEASDELLLRMSTFYYSGLNLSASMEQLQEALSDLKNAQFFTYEDACRRYHSGDADNLCANHSRAALRLGPSVQAVRNDWTQANASGKPSSTSTSTSTSLEAHAKNITKLVYQLVGTLDGSGHTPERQQEIRREKMRIGNEMNSNISAVFDRELNSTEFLVESVESQLRELQAQVDSARSGLDGARVQFFRSYRDAAAGPERARFGIILSLLMLFIICMTALAAGVAPFLLKSMRTGSRTRYFVGLLYLFSFLFIAFAILLNTAMYTAAAVLQAEACRYLWDTRSPANQTKADQFLVPEVNDVLTELRRVSAGDPNATQIPITAVGSLLGALQHSCKANVPMLVAMDAVGYIDEAALDKTAETLAFQAKGLAILRREMARVNLEQLRDEKLTENLQNLKPFFRSYATTDFTRLARRLAPRAAPASGLESQLADFLQLNEQVGRVLPESETSARQLSAMNAKNAAQAGEAAAYLRQYVRQCGSAMLQLEAMKDVNSVVDQVIERTGDLDVYLLNRSLWIETSARQYEKHIVNGTLDESVRIAKQIGIQFLSSILRCREVHEMYTAAVALPCGVLLKPLSVLCFCIGWLLCCAVVLALVTMFGFCRSRVWLSGIGALKGVESLLTGLELHENGINGNAPPQDDKQHCASMMEKSESESESESASETPDVFA